MTGKGATGWVRWRGGQQEGGDGERRWGGEMEMYLMGRGR